MPDHTTNVDRKEVFRLLVLAQDGGMTVEESRNRIAAEFGISLAELLKIEEEGRAGQWPPL